ncbi:aldo/keto reductase [Halopenitus sp. H-Gu1]|uniref:aldo/keto reductase n=1 Tax=Halopenitus sp. H-Gu1 TaxID=3242697 RepID=UPI00359ED1C7
MATREGTWRYRNRFGDSFGRTYFRRFGPGVVSSLGIGTYLGDPTAAVDERYRQSIRLALESGINVIDTAVNYRCGRSERVVGDAVRTSDIDRESVLVATKGGFVPFDGDRPADPAGYVRGTFVDPGIVSIEELAGGSHAISPSFIDAMVDRSLRALDLDTIDVYYVHNPETQLSVRSREAVYDRLEATFEQLERRRRAGEIGRYGIASWEAFRVPEDHESYLSLPAILERARRAAASVFEGGSDTAAGHGDVPDPVDSPDPDTAPDHGLRAIQLPFNVSMADAFTMKNQPLPDDPTGSDETRVSTLECARRAGVGVFTSASIGQGSLVEAIPEPIDGELAGDVAAQRAINFARSAPGVTSALVGTSDPNHVRENIAAGTFDPLGATAFDAVFQ